MRVFNFSAGPAVMPLEVLEEARSELTDWQGTGMSVMEVSHRSQAFVACAEEAEARLRSLMGIADDYAVLFLQGGAMGQFAGIPLNLTAPGDHVAFLNTGAWSTKAISEARRYDLDVEVVVDAGDTGFTTTPLPGTCAAPAGAAYLHYTPNETIGGVAFDHVPDVEVPLVADASSMILGSPLDVSRFGVIFAGTQKNLGPAGMCVVVVRRDLLGRARRETPTVLDWTQMAENGSMVNTPPTWGIYLLGRVLAWVERQGGVHEMHRRNQQKAATLYAFVDGHDFYSNPVEERSRSIMNVPFLLAKPDLDRQFVSEAEAAGLTNLAGHRSVGGMRASLYNAMPLEGVQALVAFMGDFADRHA